MSLPNNTLSQETVPDEFAIAQLGGPLSWKITGARGLQDPTYGLQYQDWVGVATRDERNNTKIKLTPEKEGEEIEVILEEFPLSQFSFAFDQNMFLNISWVACGVAKFRWWDTGTQQYVIETLPSNTTSVLSMIDDNRQFNIGGSDVIVTYLKGEDLCMRMQRDRYEVEYTLATGLVSKKLVNMGLTEALRFQFEMVDKDGWTGREPSCTSRGN